MAAVAAPKHGERNDEVDVDMVPQKQTRLAPRQHDPKSLQAFADQVTE